MRRKKQRFQGKEVKKKYNSTRDWAGLPEGILEEISERLPVTDCISFGDVCKPWRSIFADFPTRNKNRGLPWLIMSRQNSRRIRTCVSILQNNLVLDFEMCWWYLWGSFQDWLIMAKHVKKPYTFSSFLKLMLFNPFSKTKIDLPDASKEYHKMVLSTNPSEKLLMCMLVHQSMSKVAFWLPGAQEWHEHGLFGGPFPDAVFCGKSFYLVTLTNNIVKIDATSISLCNDASTLSEIKVEYCDVEMAEKRPMMGSALRYLVESCGEVLLVCRFFLTCYNSHRRTEKFVTYRLDLCRMAWKTPKSFGDQIIVLGKGCSRSYLAKDLGIQRTNCIYFLNDLCVPWSNEWDVVRREPFLKGSDETDWGIFSLRDEDEDNQGFCYHGHTKHWAPMCVTAPLWWYCRPSINE